MKLLLKHGLDAREHDAEMFGIAARHDRICGDFLDRDLAFMRLHAPQDFVRATLRRCQHSRDELLGRRYDRQTVTPSALLDVAVRNRSIGCNFVPARAPAHLRVHGFTTSAPTIASTKRCAMLDTSGSVLLAIGCSTITVGCCGMPSIFARIVAAVVNA